jgi:hypothetical protein
MFTTAFKSRHRCIEHWTQAVILPEAHSMFEQFMRSFFTAFALLLVFAATLAVGAQRANRAMKLLGDDAVESRHDLLAAGQAEAFRLWAGKTGLARLAHVYLSSANAAGTVIVGLYSDAHGRPRSLLGTGSADASKAGTWTTVWIAPTRLTSRRAYWLAVLGRGGMLRYRNRAHGPCLSQTSAQTTLRRLPRHWKTGARYRDCPVSAFVTTAVSAPAGTPRHLPARDGKGGTPTNCFATPERCGYPGPTNTGAASCSSLPPSGSVTASATGQKVQNLNITGTITVAASNVRINNVCVTDDGGGKEGSQAVRLEDGANDTTISNSTIRGKDDSAKSVAEALSNNYGGTGEQAIKDDIYNCGECIHYSWTVNDSYVLANGMKNTGEHYEDWYFNNNMISANHDTVLNPNKQTAVFFGNVNNGRGGACENHITITNSLIAGGGAMLYPCGNASSVGTSTMTIQDNRFARMRCTKREYQNGEGGWECEKGEGTGGFWPRGGFFHTAAYIFTGAGQVWEGNFWDDNLERLTP